MYYRSRPVLWFLFMTIVSATLVLNRGVRAQLLFDSNRDGPNRIYMLDVVDSTLSRLTDGWIPTVSPDGKRFAFSEKRGDLNVIYEMPLNATQNERLLTQGPYIYPLWSPLSDVILTIGFHPKEVGVDALFLISANEFTKKPLLVTDNIAVCRPAWSPDGTKIACSDGYNIWTIHPDGSNFTVIYESRYQVSCCAWSPEDSIAFRANSQDGTWRLYLVNSDGTNARLFPNAPTGRLGLPAWSPDAKVVALPVIQGGNAQDGFLMDIYVMNADGSNLRNVTNHPANDDNPVWLPSTTTPVSPRDKLATSWASLKQRGK